jgi:hypothetical protein
VPYREGFIERFWARVDKNGPVPSHAPELGQCWLWTGGKGHGYGIVSMYPDPPRRAHQISWELAGRDPVPKGLVIRHRCDVRACVNPDHLLIGTRRENNVDTHERGRWTFVPAGRGRRRRTPQRKGPKPGSVLDRFLAKIDKSGPVPQHDPSLGSCWLWTSSIHKSGYGLFFMPGKHRNAAKAKAHRVSYELFVGPIPEGLDVLHRCDVRRCVNPDHLYPGTDADNMRDRDSRGRRPPPTGTKNGRAKLTEEAVREIKRALAAGETQTSLGRRYGVAQGQISNIALGKQWAHVREPL